MLSRMQRRDYLRSLGVAAIAPAASTSPAESEGEVPDVDDSSLFWMVLLTAIDHDDPDEAVEMTEVAIEVYDAPGVKGPSADEVRQHVRATVRGEYDEAEIQQRAMEAWVSRR